MSTARLSFFLPACILLALSGGLTPTHGAIEAVVSVADQRMVVLRDGGMIARYPVSTSKFGMGDTHRSYRTPLGRLRVCDKIGDGAPAGAVMKHRQVTREVLPVNAPGRDPIVTRILWLDGCESQNSNARERSIYIHGTPEENRIGKPVSWGCIRMRSQDVIALYEELPVGASVTVVADKLPRYPKYTPPAVTPAPEIIIVKKDKEKETPGLAPIAATTPKIASVRAAAFEPATKPSSPAMERAIATGVERAVAHVPPKPAPVLGVIKSMPQFASSVPRSGPRTDLVQAMRSSILLSGTEDTSANSEIPRLDR